MADKDLSHLSKEQYEVTQKGATEIRLWQIKTYHI